jgi:hypothetical protein
MGWGKTNPVKLLELQSNLRKLSALLQAEKIKEIDKLQRVVEVFDQKTQDEILREARGR